MVPRRRSSLLVAALVSFAGGCATSVPSTPPPSPSAVPPASSPAATTTASEAPTAVPTAMVSPDAPALTVALVADELVAPIGITPAPGGWLLVSEQRGTVVAIHPERGERATVVDLTDRILAGGERGLLGLALHPNWPDDG